MNIENDKQIIIEDSKEDSEDYSIKIVIVGDSSVGKTNLLNRFVQNEFSNDSRATVGVELSTKTYKVNGKIIKFHFWDTAGQERFKSITSAYYKGAKGAIIVYDITNKDSFLHLDKWIREIKEQLGKNFNCIICGNKSDLENDRKVSISDGLDVAEANHVLFLETSALNSSNVEEAFITLIKEIFNNHIKQALQAEQEDIFNQGEIVKIESENSKLTKKKKNCC